MAVAKTGDLVKVDYTGRLNSGQIFDTSEGREPIEFVLGSHQVIPGFEEAVEGMSVGDKKTIEIPADQAYGQRREELVATVRRDQLPEDLEPKEGDILRIQREDGQVILVRITDIDETSATLDANHPLAGEDLTFDIKLVDIT
ncbi:MAG TPA: peptidylprolyl isomerase [Armatimonadota bacterium]|nr:peptidylprolyl isomerase [Armatimonadota bacterium]